MAVPMETFQVIAFASNPVYIYNQINFFLIISGGKQDNLGSEVSNCAISAENQSNDFDFNI